MLAKYRCPKECPERRSEICHTDSCETWAKNTELREIIKQNKTKDKDAQFYVIEGAKNRKSKWQVDHKGRPGK